MWHSADSKSFSNLNTTETDSNTWSPTGKSFPCHVAALEMSTPSLQLNKDLTGEIEMLTQTGPFSIPVRCTTRKCVLRATGGSSEGDERGGGDCVEVDFGRVCVGETVRGSILLRNDGALPTEFSITSSTHREQKVF